MKAQLAKILLKVNELLSFSTQFCRFIASFVPSAIPVGLTEYQAWAESIISLTGPIADDNSLKFAIASMVIHLDRDTAYVSKRWFVKCLRKAAANQVASAVFQDIKLKQQEALKAAQKPEETQPASQQNVEAKDAQPAEAGMVRQAP